jgi:hypothetical protein
MQPPDDIAPSARTLEEGLIDAMAAAVTDVVGRLSPATRLRLLAFMHLFEDPETIRADLTFSPSGSLRLTLARDSGEIRDRPDAARADTAGQRQPGEF